MQLVFSWPLFFDVLLSILWLISGIRDFMGKDPGSVFPSTSMNGTGVPCLLAEEKRRAVYL